MDWMSQIAYKCWMKIKQRKNRTNNWFSSSPLHSPTVKNRDMSKIKQKKQTYSKASSLTRMQLNLNLSCWISFSSSNNRNIDSATSLLSKGEIRIAALVSSEPSLLICLLIFTWSTTSLAISSLVVVPRIRYNAILCNSACAFSYDCCCNFCCCC